MVQIVLYNHSSSLTTLYIISQLFSRGIISYHNIIPLYPNSIWVERSNVGLAQNCISEIGYANLEYEIYSSESYPSLPKLESHKILHGIK